MVNSVDYSLPFLSFPMNNVQVQPLIDQTRYNALHGIPSEVAREQIKKKLIRILPGCGAGALLGLLTSTTGLEAALHEVVGHGLLGYHLTIDYPPGEGPHFQVNGWDNLQAIGKAESFEQGVTEFFRFLTGYDRPGNGTAGLAYRGNGTPNALGKMMGPKGQSAWFSITGSIPGLVLNSLLVAGGMKLKEYEPTSGYLLLTMGAVQHLGSCSYPWSAAVMSDQSLVDNAAIGHDFANFAVQIGDLTGIPYQAVAISTAIIWTAIVPAIAFGMHFYLKSHQTDIVSDHVALQEWLEKAKDNEKVGKTLIDYFLKYPRKELLLHQWSENNKSQLKIEMRRFVEYLIDSLPKKTLKDAKKSVIRKWEKLQEPDKIQTAFTILSVVSSIATIATKIITILGQTIAPYLATVGTVLTYASPAFVAVSIASNGYEVYKDLKSSDRNVPKAAKILCIAKLVVSIASGVGLTIGLFIPGLNVVLISSIVIGLISGIALTYARQRVIKHRFELLQSIEPSNWSSMYTLLKVYDEDHSNIKIKKEEKGYRGLFQWLKLQKEAFDLKLLDVNQTNKLFKYSVLHQT